MPPFHKDVSKAFEASVRFAEVLGEIARERKDNGRPLAAETARQMAREVLDKQGFIWPKQERNTGQQQAIPAPLDTPTIR